MLNRQNVLNCIKRKLRNFRFTKNLYYYLSKVKANWIHSSKLKNMHHYGESTIQKLEEILEESGLLFFFDMGTLLGIVREGKILKHDLDIDIGVFVSSEEGKKSLLDLLVMNECKRRFSYSITGLGIVEESFILNNIKFDVNYYYREKNNDACFLMYSLPEKDYTLGHQSVVKLVCKPILSTCKIQFGNGNITIPSNSEAYLAERYGANWQTPDKSYIYWKGPSAIPTDYTAFCTVFE